ncbi:hypothetical protein EVAR_47458_1 [Eumeta japonica]|uniref:Uncharacterized protein n=1 Tax=Eumeta variegata TaxID=151549 RepID=A0A4C1XCA6_EUMVA|nr:hypothetical protein EVAR_47458_1 [Eumeta japonica]
MPALKNEITQKRKLDRRAGAGGGGRGARGPAFRRWPTPSVKTDNDRSRRTNTQLHTAFEALHKHFHSYRKIKYTFHNEVVLQKCHIAIHFCERNTDVGYEIHEPFRARVIQYIRKSPVSPQLTGANDRPTDMVYIR